MEYLKLQFAKLDFQNPKHLALVASGSITLGYVLYKTIQTFQSQSFKQTKIRANLIELLQAFNEDNIEKEDLIITLKTLCDQSAFTEIQEKIRSLGYLPKIIQVIKYPDLDVQCQVALLINNLAMNVQNQTVLKDSIPQLIQILCKNVIKDETIKLFTAVLCALTNLTALDESHSTLLPKMIVFCELLTQCEIVQVKLQVLKIFVNISTNKRNCENDFELAAMMIRSVECFLTIGEEERYLLRAVCCCANVLEAIHSRWKHDTLPHISPSEFVNQKLHDNLIKLSTHPNEDIHNHAMRALRALRPPPIATSSPHQEYVVDKEGSNNNGSLMGAVDNLDLLDVLKI
ncbi:armadillo repeat-containing protein 10-like [Clytia hemisphaerica]|uniref:Armadillo repeat-containing domain-containing protein n=1 Tax=Clytia hemisphaerica TaxID=252671 RepID=A0A7M5V8Y4_9CNID|eukprot:TCONS_00062682-protein